MVWFWILALFYTCTICVQAYGRGAPAGVCQTMTPKHGANITSQTGKSPYDFSMSAKDNNEYEVIIEAPPGEFFQGFMILPREENDRDKIVKGEFTETPESQLVNCGNGEGNFLTHKSGANKTKLVTKWIPSADFEGNVIMRATVLRTKTVFWTNVDTPLLSISKREDFIGTSTFIPSKPTDQGKYGDPSGGCGKDRSCFGMPQNCEGISDCSVLLTYVLDSSLNAVEFEITAATGSLTEMWIAAGLSENNLMGDDSVADCILADGKASFYYSWNQRRSNDIIQKGPDGVELLDSSFADGILRCRWRRPTRTFENEIAFNLLNNSYYILLAKGPLRTKSPIVKERHSDRLASDGKVNLTSITVIGGSSTPALVKLHGCLMIIAWVGLVSIGILLARHYKDVWEEKTLCNVKIWFAFHRGLMMTSIAMAVIAFIIIFAHVGEWSSSATAHAVFGCISTAFGILQPLGALFRPGPQDPKRPIFNWAHWSGGNIAQIAAFIAIFLAVEIPAANLPSAFTWVFAIFIAYHCLFHLLLQVYIWQVEKKKSNEINMMDLSGDKKNETKTPGEKFKKTMLAIYSFPVAGLVITLLFIVGLQ